MWLLFVLSLVLVTNSRWRSGLRCEGSMDTVCRWVTLLQQQVHHLRHKGNNLLRISVQVVVTKQPVSITISPHLPRVSKSLDCLLMSGSLQTFPIDSHHTITYRHRITQSQNR